MINANDFKTNGKTINANKLQERKELQAPLTVSDVKEENMNDRKKLTLTFLNVQDTLVLNQANLNVMITAKGADASKWVGAKVTLILIPSRYNGQPVQSVFISKVQ